MIIEIVDEICEDITKTLARYEAAKYLEGIPVLFIYKPHGIRKDVVHWEGKLSYNKPVVKGLLPPFNWKTVKCQYAVSELEGLIEWAKEILRSEGLPSNCLDIEVYLPVARKRIKIAEMKREELLYGFAVFAMRIRKMVERKREVG